MYIKTIKFSVHHNELNTRHSIFLHGNGRHLLPERGSTTMNLDRVARSPTYSYETIARASINSSAAARAETMQIYYIRNIYYSAIFIRGIKQRKKTENA